MYTYFSYANMNNSNIDLETENENRFVVGDVITAYPADPQLRTHFLSGSHPTAFQIVSSNSTTVAWTLNGQTAVLESANVSTRCDTQFSFLELTLLFGGTFVPTKVQNVIDSVFVIGSTPIARSRITGSGRQTSASKRAPEFEMTFIFAPHAPQPTVTAHSLAAYFYTFLNLPAYRNNLASFAGGSFLDVTNRTVYLDFVTPTNDVPFFDGPLGDNVPPPFEDSPYTPPPPDYYTNPIYEPSRNPSQPVTPGSTGTDGAGPNTPTGNVLFAPNSLGLPYIYLIAIIGGALVLAILLFLICCCCCNDSKPKRPTLRQQLAEEKARQEAMKQDYWEAMFSANGGTAAAGAVATGGPGPARQRRRNRMMDALDESSDSFEVLGPQAGGAAPMVSMAAAPDDVPIAGGPGAQGYGTNRFGTQRRQRNPAALSAPPPQYHQTQHVDEDDDDDDTDSYEEEDSEEDYDEDTDSQ
jgi:hypothetical protein